MALAIALGSSIVVAPFVSSVGVPRVQAAAAKSMIRTVDFYNRPWELDDGVIAEVTDGSWQTGSNDAGDLRALTIYDVDHGDIDGDGNEEAIVSVSENTGGTGQFSDAVVFRWTAKGPVRVTSHGVGDRADGGLYNVVIVNGEARIDRFTKGEGACCPTEVTLYPVKLRGNRLVNARTAKARAFIVLGTGGGGTSNVIKFLRGTSSAAYEGASGDSAVFDAGKGQTVTLTAMKQRRGVGSSGVRLLRGSTLVGTVGAGAVGTFRLSAAGRYTVIVAPGSTDNSYASGELSIK